MTTRYTRFDDSMKESYTILVPYMLPIHFRLITPVFKKSGYTIVPLDNVGSSVREEGLSHVHNDTCYPALLVIGQFIDALKSGKYDLDHTALAITQTAGGCRASNYLSLLRKALAMEGWEYIPTISINFSGLEKDSSLHFTLPLILRVIYGALYGDSLMWLKNQIKPYEVNKGDTDQAVDDMIEYLIEELDGNGFRRSKKIFKTMLERFKAVKRSGEPKIRVGIVGEIYMKYSPLGNRNLEEYLINEGFEPVVSGVMDFILYVIENALIDYRYYNRNAGSHQWYEIAKSTIIHLQKNFIHILEKDGTFRAPDDFNEVVQNGKGIINPGVKMGEGWLLTSEVVTLIRTDVKNVISAQPFGCLPNHIVAKGMTRKIKEKYPFANIVAIDYDPSASSVNQENRIRLMLANARLSEQWKNEN